jgi:acyl-CoA reductase-like NAD-dependent aldehyde dehydrogenase
MDYDEKPDAPNPSRDAWAEWSARMSKERDAALAKHAALVAAARELLAAIDHEEDLYAHRTTARRWHESIERIGNARAALRALVAT